MLQTLRAALVVTASTLVLSACTTSSADRDGLRPAAEAPAAPTVLAANTAAEAPPKSDSLYGNFLSGRSAEHAGRSSDAAIYYSQLATEDTENAGFLREKAFLSAILAGDIQTAAKMAPASPPAETSGQAATNYKLGRLTQAIDLLAAGDAPSAYQRLTTEDLGEPHRATASIIAPWAAALAGNVEASLVQPSTREPLAAPFGLYGQAELFERAGRFADAEKTFKTVIDQTTGMALFPLGYGEFLERRGRRAEAIGVYEGVLRESPNDLSVQAALARAKARGRPPAAVTPLQGAGQAMLALGAGLFSQRQVDTGYFYLRLALRLDPNRNEAWLMVGDYLAQAGDQDGAREAFARIPASSPAYLPARTRLAFNYAQDEDLPKALDVARDMVRTAPKSAEAQGLLADLLNGADQYDEAIKVLNGVIAQQGEAASWRLYYTRAISHERAGRWPDAERDLQKALALSPNETDVLNYLGYSWADRGERLPEALSMLQKANRANPASGAIVDSLGWAYFRMGDFARALLLLEQAVRVEPADADINNHLGDAYWRAGRQLEARYQWTRVLSLKPNAKLKAEVEAKLTSGLPPLSTPTTTAAAANGS